VRVGLVSDLHIDHHPEVTELISARAAELGLDALVVAGDLTPRVDGIRDTLARLRAAGPRVLFVPGNHDLWCDEEGPDSRTRYLDLLPEAAYAAGAAYLPAGPVDLGGLVLVGQTGWYDYSLADASLEIPRQAYVDGRYGKLAWSDKRFVRWPGLASDEELAGWMAERLAGDLAALPDGARTLVVTHVLPFAELVVRRPLPWGFVGGFLGSTRLGQISLAAARRLDVVRHWCGHTHFRVDAEVSGLRAETSPIGYPREIARQGDGPLAAHVAGRVHVLELPA
jgi:hypothetical protein